MFSAREPEYDVELKTLSRCMIHLFGKMGREKSKQHSDTKPPRALSNPRLLSLVFLAHFSIAVGVQVRDRRLNRSSGLASSCSRLHFFSYFSSSSRMSKHCTRTTLSNFPSSRFHVAAGTTPQFVQMRNSAVAVPMRYRLTEPEVLMLRVPEASEVYDPPCSLQKPHWQALAPSSDGVFWVRRWTLIPPQWQAPW